MKALLKEHIIFILIIASCSLLRFLPLFEYQFTYDEWSGLFRTQFNSFAALIDNGVKIDAHPAFVQVLIYYLSKVFGYTDWIIKLPFLLFSIGAIFYAYAFCLRNFSKQAALVAAVIFSYSLVFVYYAPIARMYISGVFFSVGLLYHFSEICFLKNSKKVHFFFVGFFALLSALNQHINGLFAFMVCSSAIFFIDKKDLKPYIITCVTTIIFYLPHLPVTLYQLGLGGIGFEQGGWLAAPGVSDLFELIKLLLGTGRTYIVILIICAAAVILNRKFFLSKVQVFLLVIFLFNFFIVYFYSVYRAPIYQHSVMLFSGAGFILALSPLITFNNRNIFFGALFTVSFLLLYKTYIKKDYLHQSVKNIFEYQFERTAGLKQKYDDATVYPVFFDVDTFMKKVCFSKYNTRFKCSITGEKELSNSLEFSKLVSGLNSDYLVLASSFPPEQGIAKEYYPYLIESKQTQGLNFKVYSRKESDKDNLAGDDNILYSSTPFKPGNFTYGNINSKVSGNELSLAVDSLNQFPLGAEAMLSEVSGKEGQIILLKIKLKLNTMNPGDIIACVSENNKNNDSCYAYVSKSAQDYLIKKDSTVIIYANMFLGTNYKEIKEKSKLKAYLWNKGQEKFRITNFEILTLDFWPQKWNYWE